MKQWQFQEAKSKLSEVIKDAVKKGPQEITVRGKSTAVILSIEEYKNLITPQTSFVEFLQNSPLYGVELNIERIKSLNRDIEL